MIRTNNALLNARCEAIEARMDTRVADIKADLKATNVALRQSIVDNKATVIEIRKQITNLKYIFVTTALASVIGLYAASVVTRQALLSAYDSGQAMATEMAQAAQRIQSTNERLDLLEARIERKINQQPNE